MHSRLCAFLGLFQGRNHRKTIDINGWSVKKTFNGDGPGLVETLKNHRWQWCLGKKKYQKLVHNRCARWNLYNTRHFYKTFTILLQYYYNTITILLQYFNNTFTILLQYQYLKISQNVVNTIDIVGNADTVGTL